MRHLLAMDMGQCVTCLLWTQVNASPVVYGRKLMRHLLVMDASQCVTCQLDASHTLPVNYGRKSRRYLAGK